MAAADGALWTPVSLRQPSAAGRY